MDNTAENSHSTPPRVLMFSQRNIFPNIHYRLGLHEFEDLIMAVDSVDLVAPRPATWFKYGTRVANRLATDYAVGINPSIPRITVRKDYDVFFAIVQFPKDLLHVQNLHGWKEHCKTSVCWLNELWVSELHKYRYFLQLLSQFDYVVVHWAGSVRAVQEVVSARCFYQPYGVDAFLFCPYPDAPQRVIDVYSIGRRSEKTHRALLRLADGNKLFYVYDTFEGYQVDNAQDHRSLVANMVKRSRYFMVNPGKIDSPEETRGQSEFGNRFFEGAAAGTIMVGETPTNDQFKKVFDWNDAVIQFPFGSADFQAVMDELDRDPERQARIRKTNVVQSLKRHDWVYRWEAVLHTVGLEPMPALSNRKRRLAHLADLVETAGFAKDQ